MAEGENYTDIFEDEEDKMSFLDHLDELRAHLLRSGAAVFILACVVFAFPKVLFDGIILAPTRVDFVSYQMMCKLSKMINGLNGICIDNIPFTLFNPELSGQFMKHITVSFIVGFILAFPYFIWEIWRFVRPALKPVERKNANNILFFVSILFFVGVLFGYFLLSPVSIYFLGSYQISDAIENKLTFDSYVSTLTMITLGTGLVFELPILAYFFAKIGLISSQFLKNSRRYAIVINAVVAAVITPPDVGSMALMIMPLVLLYEVSIIVVRRVERQATQLMA